MQIVPHSPEGYRLLHDGMLCFSDMQQNGIKMDIDHLKKEFVEHGKKIKRQEKKLEEFKEIKLWKDKYKKNFSLRSDEQLSDILFKELEYTPSKYTDKGSPSVDHEALQNLKLPFTDELILHRKYEKIRNTYLKGLIKETCNGYLHPFINLHTARTFRSSSSHPNAQNMPIRDPQAGEVIRKAFITRKDHCLVAADYGGIEVKGSAFYHKDPTMLSYLKNPEESDMHSDFACLLFKLPNLDQSIPGEKTLRKGTKNGFTFPQFYGDYYGNNAPSLWEWMGLRGNKINSKQGVVIRDEKTIGQHLIENGIKNFKQFENHVKGIEKDMWENRFPVYKKWRDEQYKWYVKHGYVSILSGFICQGLMDRNATINYPIQGVCFHCLLWACIRLNHLLKKHKMKSKLIFQVHDEIVADVYKDEYNDYLKMLKQVMINELKDHWKFINVPLEIEVEASAINGNWFEMDKVFTYIN